jgi:hypothetical protein
MLKSAPPPGQDLTEEEWEVELKRRADEIDSGKVECRDWEDVKNEFDERFGQ